MMKMSNLVLFQRMRHGFQVFASQSHVLGVRIEMILKLTLKTHVTLKQQ